MQSRTYGKQMNFLEDIQERIQDLDSDRCIDFYHRKQEKKINTLLEGLYNVAKLL